MVNEVYEAQQYLAGENINRTNLYRICYLLISLFKNQGYKRTEIRDMVFAWGSKNKITVEYDVNSIINRVFDIDNLSLSAPIIKINKQDIYAINKLFDNEKVRLVALAILCYAKAHANKKGEFYVSSVGLGAWLGINRKTLRSRYIKELIDFEYLVEVEKYKNNNKWNDSYDKQSTKYRLNTSLHNSGEFVLRDNDVRKLFSEVFFSPY